MIFLLHYSVVSQPLLLRIESGDGLHETTARDRIEKVLRASAAPIVQRLPQLLPCLATKRYGADHLLRFFFMQHFRKRLAADDQTILCGDDTGIILQLGAAFNFQQIVILNGMLDDGKHIVVQRTVVIEELLAQQRFRFFLMIAGILIRGHDLRIKQQTRISERFHLFEGKTAALHFRIVHGEPVRPFLSTPLILRPVALGVKLQRVMRGHTTTYWKEVEEIIAGGDDAIIQFLKDNCQDYKEAGKLQAEAYVDEWKKKLEDLRNAYKQVSGDIKAYDYTPTASAKNSGSSSKGSSSSKKTTKVTKYQATYPTIGSKRGGTLKGYASPEEAEKAARSKINSICRELSGSSSSMIGEWARTFYSKIKVTAYAKGGLNQATGLAWLDGTKAKPERVLSPYQTELFEDLLKTLHAIRTVQVPQAVVRPQLPETVQNQPLTIESITVNVERLEKEADYDSMAERVGEKIMERAMRGIAVGGLRLG